MIASSLGLEAFVSTVIFLQKLFVLEKKKFCLPPPHIYIAYAVTLSAGLVFWVSLVAVTGDVLTQLSFGFTYSVMSWTSLVVVVNEKLMFPSRNQVYALGFRLLTNLGYQLQLRLVLNLLKII